MPISEDDILRLKRQLDLDPSSSSIKNVLEEVKKIDTTQDQIVEDKIEELQNALNDIIGDIKGYLDELALPPVDPGPTPTPASFTAPTGGKRKRRMRTRRHRKRRSHTKRR